MQMTFRWYGEGNDRIKLSDIKQIPGVKGIGEKTASAIVSTAVKTWEEK